MARERDAAEVERAYLGTAAGARRRARGQGRLHGRPRPLDRRAGRGGRRAASALDDAAAARPALRAPSSTTSARSRCPRRSSTSPGPLTPDERGDHGAPHARRRADPRAGRVPGAACAGSCATSTSAGTATGYPDRPAPASDDPARRADRARLRRAARDDVSDRPYRARAAATRRAPSCAATRARQFDPRVVEALLAEIGARARHRRLRPVRALLASALDATRPGTCGSRARPGRPGRRCGLGRLARTRHRATALAAAGGVGLQPLAAVRRGPACTARSAPTGRGVWRQLRDDHHTLAELVVARGWPEPARLAAARWSRRGAATSARRARDAAGPRAAHAHAGPPRAARAFPLAAPVRDPVAGARVFGVPDVEFRAIRRTELSPLEIAALHGRSPGDVLQAMSPADPARPRRAPASSGPAR